MTRSARWPAAGGLNPVDDAVRALIALLVSIERSPAAPAVSAFKSALRRHGQNLADTAGPDALHTAMAQIEAMSPAYAAPRRATLIEAWADLPAGAAWIAS